MLIHGHPWPVIVLDVGSGHSFQWTGQPLVSLADNYEQLPMGHQRRLKFIGPFCWLLEGRWPREFYREFQKRCRRAYLLSLRLAQVLLLMSESAEVKYFSVQTANLQHAAFEFYKPCWLRVSFQHERVLDRGDHNRHSQPRSHQAVRHQHKPPTRACSSPDTGVQLWVRLEQH